MRGTVAVTDYGWYEFLRGRGLPEVNFWTPSDRHVSRAPQFSPFFFKLKVRYPSAEHLHTILDRTTTPQSPVITKVLHNAQEVVAMREVVRQVPIAREIQAHAVNLVLSTHPEEATASPLAKKFVRYGASPRGAQALILAAKIYALLDNRYHVARVDIDKAALDALRHRIILNFEGEAEGASTDDVINEILKRRS
jgi:MoxR-like ATPase